MESRFREEHTMKINEDHVEFDFVERAVDIKLKGGKMTKKKVEHGRIIGKGLSVEYSEHLQHWVSFVRNKYSSGMLTEDKHGRKLFCNFDQKTLEVMMGTLKQELLQKYFVQESRSTLVSQVRI